MLKHLPGLFLLLAVGGLFYFASIVCVIMLKLVRPPRRTYVSAMVRNMPGEPNELNPPLAWTEWHVRSGGLELPVWDIVGLNPNGPAIIFTHGWGDSRIGALARMAHFAPFASRLIAWDMPGHGEAPGRTRLGRREADDLLALIERIESPRIVLCGWSLGAGVSIVAAHSCPRIIGVIAEAPYRVPMTPAQNVLESAELPSGLPLRLAMFMLGFTPRSVREFDRVAQAARVECPLLVLHGEYDRISPPEDGRDIAEAAPYGRFVLIREGTHNGLWIRPESLLQCTTEIERFEPLRSYDSTDAHSAAKPDC